MRLTESAERLSTNLRARQDKGPGRCVTLDLSAGVSARNDDFSIVSPRTGPGIIAKDPIYAAEPAHLEQAVMFSNKTSIGLSAAF